MWLRANARPMLLEVSEGRIIYAIVASLKVPGSWYEVLTIPYRVKGLCVLQVFVFRSQGLHMIPRCSRWPESQRFSDKGHMLKRVLGLQELHTQHPASSCPWPASR